MRDLSRTLLFFLLVTALAVMSAVMFVNAYSKNSPAVFETSVFSSNPAKTGKPDKEFAKQLLFSIAPEEKEFRREAVLKKLIKGDTKQPKIALTFDDGPHPGYTPQILAILKRYDIKATFFVVGERAAQYPWLVRKEFLLGHTIGDHTYHHLNLDEISSMEARDEIQSCGNIIEKITGERTHIFRPPGGDYNRNVVKVANELGYTMVLWTDNSGDCANIGKKAIKSRVFARLNNGGIILFHDGIKKTIDILPQVIDSLKGLGFKFVTIDNMINSLPKSKSSKY